MTGKSALRILLTGAAGLVGQGVALACQRSPQVAHLTALVRRPGSLNGPGSELIVPDFLHMQGRHEQLAGFDACFYCAGAPPVGTAEAEYRRVTLDITLAVARAWAAANPEGRFLYVSGAGADPQSRVMPLRVKGETEVALQALPVRTVMLRPGGVRPVPGTGTRHALLKPLYWGGAPLMKLAGAVAPSLMTSNLALGQAMIALAGREHPPGTVECADINRIAAGARDPAS
ncbi:oxidoreductase [Stenotrophomonas maltophilia]|uniref:NAD-dependent epimerase/dehydratase family protein n=1 Tax=Stenotrophomonas maltophilia group TaxID=995085 RepID=UPI00083F5342|nr:MULTISPECIES: NAD-dependent epimerase/dehydratase family protein [Stenotrophomonas maltophilia group]MBY6280547.1 oxidoreductase [Stenotrophomonas maltophilia]PSD25311.1 oxidoreductase [Stenotrophomonas maltophilia]PZT01340.1 oxidoreductase [Stenotrophomonas maltophilia]